MDLNFVWKTVNWKAALKHTVVNYVHCLIIVLSLVSILYLQ
jgi:hypothetical protein